MASINGFYGNITGASGSVNALEPKSGWSVYIFPRGAHASAASTGTTVTFDSTDAAARITANDWVQVGTSTANIRQATAVAGGSITVNTAVTVAENDRVFRIGATQPTVTAGNATYQPNTTIRPRDDDGATAITNSVLTTDSNGLYQFFAADNLYDAMVQDANGSNQGSIIDLALGNARVIGDLLPDDNNTRDIGSSTLNWKDIYVAGTWISGVSDASGSTVFHYSNATGLTQGNLFSYEMNDVTLVSGDTWGGIFDSWSLPQVFNVKSAKFGAKGDNSTDDSTAIQAAIDEAATNIGGDVQGGIVYFPRGTYIVESAIVNKNRVRLVGEGARNSSIKAGSTFPTTGGAASALVRIGDGTSNVFGCRIEHMELNCDDISGTIGVYSNEAQEGSGVFDFLIRNFDDAGIFFETAGCQNFKIANGEVLLGTVNVAAGISFNTVSSVNPVQNVTVNNDSDQITGPAIGVTGADISVSNSHAEFYDTGILYGANSSGTARGFFGHSSLDNCVVIQQAGVGVLDIAPGGATNAVSDQVNGATISSAENSGWVYFTSNGAPVGGTKSILNTSAEAWGQNNAPFIYGATLSVGGDFVSGATTTINGPLVVGSRASLASAATVTLPAAGSYFVLTGTTDIATINGGVTGRVIVLEGSTDGSLNFLTTGNLQLVNGTNDTITADDLWTFIYNGTNWLVLSNSVNA